MGRRGLRWVAVASLLAGLAIALVAPGGPSRPRPAAADHGANFFPYWWSPPAPVFFYFRDDFPGGSYRSRLINGFEQWNVHNRSLRWFQGGFDLGWYSTRCEDLPPQRNGIWWMDLPTGMLGQTFRCPYLGTTRLKAVTIQINSRVNWYTGTGYPASNQYDLWSVATHEVGPVLTPGPTAARIG